MCDHDGGHCGDGGYCLDCPHTTPQPTSNAQVPEGYVLVPKKEIEKLQEAADNADMYANDYGQGGKPGEQFEKLADFEGW